MFDVYQGRGTLTVMEDFGDFKKGHTYVEGEDGIIIKLKDYDDVEKILPASIEITKDIERDNNFILKQGSFIKIEYRD